MNKIKKEFLGKRVLGAPESAMRVLSMWLMKKSRKVVPVMTSMKDERVSLPKPQSHLAQLHDDDEDIFATSLIDRYGARPVSLQNMCLATFAVTYDVIQHATQKADMDTDNEDCMCTMGSHYVSAAWPKKSGQLKTQFSLIYTAISH